MKRIVLDTETVGDVKRHKSLRVYDIGYIILDDDLEPILERRYLIDETWHDKNDMMKTAYYSEKLPSYHEQIDNGILKVAHLLDVRKEFIELCKSFNVKELWAYNAKFDVDALNATITDASNGFVKFFFPFGLKICCLHSASVNSFMSRKPYFQFCFNHGFISEAGNILTNAESAYNFITDNGAFIEEHTALSDARIEAEILRKVKRSHTKVIKEPSFTSWQVPQKKFHIWLKRKCEENVKN